MSELETMIAEAKERDGNEITPCVNQDGFVVIDEGEYGHFFWYNLPSGTTHCIIHR